MGVTYAQRSDVAALEPAELGERLMRVVTEAKDWLVQLSEERVSAPEREGKWSGKQVVGHLTDSAVNNLGRIIRMQIEAAPSLSGYRQMEWVNLQGYAKREWAQVLALWFALNEHVAWTIEHIEKARLANRGVVEGEPLTLGFLIADYIAHMEHHLRAMRLWMGITGQTAG